MIFFYFYQDNVKSSKLCITAFGYIYYDGKSFNPMGPSPRILLPCEEMGFPLESSKDIKMPLYSLFKPIKDLIRLRKLKKRVLNNGRDLRVFDPNFPNRKEHYILL